MSGADQPGRTTGDKIIRFAIVGVANTAIDLASFSLLLWLKAPPLGANVGAGTSGQHQRHAA